MGSREIIKQEIRFKLKQFYKHFCKHIDDCDEISDFNKVYQLFDTTDSVFDVVVAFGPQTQDIISDDVKLKCTTTQRKIDEENALQEAIVYIDHLEGLNEDS